MNDYNNTIIIIMIIIIIIIIVRVFLDKRQGQHLTSP